MTENEREFWIAIRAGVLGLLAIIRRFKKEDPFWMEIAAEAEGVASVIGRKYSIGKKKPAQEHDTIVVVNQPVTVQNLTQEQIDDLR